MAQETKDTTNDNSRRNEIDAMLSKTNAEMERSKTVLQALANEVAALAEVVQPALDKQIQTFRSARMTIITEIAQGLAVMKDVRKFFLEDDYAKEMERLERFISACERLRALKQDGTLDAVAELAIRLALPDAKA